MDTQKKLIEQLELENDKKETIPNSPNFTDKSNLIDIYFKKSKNIIFKFDKIDELRNFDYYNNLVRYIFVNNNDGEFVKRLKNTINMKNYDIEKFIKYLPEFLEKTTQFQIETLILIFYHLFQSENSLMKKIMNDIKRNNSSQIANTNAPFRLILDKFNKYYKEEKNNLTDEKNDNYLTLLLMIIYNKPLLRDYNFNRNDLLKLNDSKTPRMFDKIINNNKEYTNLKEKYSLKNIIRFQNFIIDMIKVENYSLEFYIYLLDKFLNFHFNTNQDQNFNEKEKRKFSYYYESIKQLLLQNKVYNNNPDEYNTYRYINGPKFVKLVLRIIEEKKEYDLEYIYNKMFNLKKSATPQDVKFKGDIIKNEINNIKLEYFENINSQKGGGSLKFNFIHHITKLFGF